MPPTNPWGKKPPQHNAASSGFPDLKPSKSNEAVPKPLAPKSQYEEDQKNELIALASIYEIRSMLRNTYQILRRRNSRNTSCDSDRHIPKDRTTSKHQGRWQLTRRDTV
ncbi:hypothetical protein NA56DRAFT_363272 [Hyaloscypha hepaticicola]|uniref:Uncharacterized protein n=1 Tax=Hyaloscypha hepaticicola TaxID=2082293 RepID=A0A2J6PLD1_9HELO|nr:hypothetical protein NA56DRAFT_363272 [Hyaloscypha hepaticicola]